MAESDDRDFDALLMDHADVRAAYRATSVDEHPPESLDAAILAASRRAVNAGPRSGDRSGRFVSRMAVPLSAAAVVVLATSLSFLVYEERGTPSAPEPSRTVRAPASDATTAGDADQAAEASAPAAAPMALPPFSSKSERQETPQLRVAPLARNTESVGPPPAAAPVRALKPPLGRPSQAIADTAALSAPMPGATAERDAMAARYAEAASERSAARNEVQESLAQAESARASSSGSVTERAAEASSEDRLARQLAARRDLVAEPPSTASMPTEAPAAISAKRLASPARERAMDSMAREEARPKTALDPEETPVAWIVRIRSLMDAGRTDAARAELARFRCRHPDLTLPSDLPAPTAGIECPATAAKEGSSDLR